MLAVNWRKLGDMTIWRPTDSTPLTPLRTPFGLLADSVEADLDARGFTRYATKALMDANTTAADGTHATVYADGTPANNGDYVSDGAVWTTTKSIATRSGSASGTTSAGGDIAVTYATAFPTATTAVSVQDTNVGAGIGPVGWKTLNKTAAGFTARAMNASGTAIAGLATTFDYIATGS